MLAELSECSDSLKLNENELLLYKDVITSAIKDKKLFVEDILNRKVKIQKPFPADVIAGTWFVQIKCQKLHKEKRWTRLYGCHLVLQHVLQDTVLVQDSLCGGYGRRDLHTTSDVANQKKCLFKIIKMFRTKSKLYMTITRKTDKNEYESYYLSKRIM